MDYIFYNNNKKSLEIVSNDPLDKLYYLKYRLPIQDEINKYTLKDKIKKIIDTHKAKDIIQIMKQSLSKIEDKVPLFDIFSYNIYLINKNNVYERITNQHYRFPDIKIISKLKKIQESNKKTTITDPLNKRLANKINLMILFMDYFDIDILYNTYIRVFYKYSVYTGKEITTCQRPSFHPYFYHLKPYFKQSEIINMGLNNEIIKSDIDIANITDETIKKLCENVRDNDMSFSVLLIHKEYMLDKSGLGMMQYYTLQGSSMMNRYLRDKTLYKTKNETIEALIKPVWEMILDAPPFDKNYIFYRFIANDDFLRSLKIGDIFTEKGFMSTTRDAFYNSDVFQFGFILLKINVPKNKKGVALCLETISHFPQEQEIIFPPESKFKLKKKDNDCVYYHTDSKFGSKIKTRYEFDWIENGNIIFQRREALKTKMLPNLLQQERNISMDLMNRIKIFESDFVDKMGQMYITLNNTQYTVFCEWYDSTNVYNKFYAMKIKNGFSMYTLHKGFILFFIEIGENDNKERQMQINYYVKYNIFDINTVVSNEELINLYSMIAYYFDIHTIIIYANYVSSLTKIVENNTIRINDQEFGDGKINYAKIYGGSYCIDIYNYFLHNKKRYDDMNILNKELFPKFSYYDLDILKKTSLNSLINKEDGELYQVYEKEYLELYKKNDNVADFYIWLVEAKCYLVEFLMPKLDIIFGDNNPFRNDYYIFDPISYLYNRKKIDTYSSGIKIYNVERNLFVENDRSKN
jgi:hypothetical protein